MKTRRDFLTSCSVLAAVAALEPTTLLSAPVRRAAGSFDQLCLSDWVPLVGTTFRLIGAGQSVVRLQLTEAQGKGAARQPHTGAGISSEHQFSLLFRGVHDQELEQNTYSFEHALLGRFAMFIVPVLPRGGSTRCYEAIFNRQSGPVV